MDLAHTRSYFCMLTKPTVEYRLRNPGPGVEPHDEGKNPKLRDYSWLGMAHPWTMDPLPPPSHEGLTAPRHEPQHRRRHGTDPPC